MATVVEKASGKRKRKDTEKSDAVLCSQCQTEELPLIRQRAYGGTGVCGNCEDLRKEDTDKAYKCEDCGQPLSFGEWVHSKLCATCDPERCQTADSRLNDAGVYESGLEVITAPLVGRDNRCSAEVHLVERLDGRWTYGLTIAGPKKDDIESYAPSLDTDHHANRQECREAAYAEALQFAVDHRWNKDAKAALDVFKFEPPAVRELPSLASIARRTAEAQRVADPSYVPTVDEALRNPAEFVAGMQETSGLSTVTPAGIAAIDPEAVHPKAEPRAIGHHGHRKPAEWINERNPRYRLVIDPEFRDACRALSEDERRRLRENIQKLGCLQPLIAWWDGKQLLLVDGHHRWAICQELDIWVTIQTSDFTDRAEVLRWIREHQAGRRNMTPDELQKMLAEDYAAELASRKEAKRQRGTQKEETIPQALKRLNAEAAAEENGAQREPRKATEGKKDPRLNESGVYVKGFKRVSVPFAPSHRCEATFGLIERADGTWVYDYDYRHRLGGGGGPATASGKGFPDRDTCLRAAAERLAEMATKDQDPRCWPKGAINAILKWQASLPQPQKPARAKKAAQVVAEKHGVSPATVKRAAKAQRDQAKLDAQLPFKTKGLSRREIAVLATLPQEQILLANVYGQDGLKKLAAQQKGRKSAKRSRSEDQARKEATKHIERYLDTMGSADAWQASDYLLDALNQWRGRHKPRATKAARITRRKPR